MLNDDSIVQLNVGGVKYTTLLGTVRMHKASILCQMFTPPFAIHHDQRDGGNTFFMDRNGEVFSFILDYLRTGVLVVPRDPVLYVILRREVLYYGLPISSQLPAAQPLMWEAAPSRFRHARIVVDEIEKSIEWDEGSLPPDIYNRTLHEIVAFFSSRGYKVVSEYTSRGTKGLTSVWMRKKEYYPGADVAVEIRDLPQQPMQPSYTSSPSPNPSGGYGGMPMPGGMHNPTLL